MSIALSSGAEEQLRLALTPVEPVGPSAAEGLKGWPDAAAYLFEPQNEIYEAMSRHSAIIVGRRGSGKTAYLDHVRRSRGPADTVDLNAPDVFVQILRSIRSVFSATPMVEAVAELWEIVIWSCVFSKLLDIEDDARVQRIRDFAGNIGFDNASRPEKVIQLVVTYLMSQVAEGQAIDSGIELKSALEFSTGSYETALQAAIGVIDTHRRRFAGATVLVLMDTLEDLRVEAQAERDALSGLVRFVGQQSLQRGKLDVRFCLPAELYETVRGLSSNPTKDFNAQVLLQWTAGELWKVAAHRFMIYLRLYDRAAHDHWRRKHNVEDRAGAISFFTELLPAEICNLGDIREPSLTYILRHTQLLPRHHLQLLNRILAKGIDRRTQRWLGVDEEAVIRGVAETVELVGRGIVGAYKPNYPWLWQFCAAALPEMPRRMKEGDLRKVFNQKIRRVIARLVTEGQAIDLDFPHFRQILIEVGIIGKQRDETDIFWEALYEYSVPEELSVSDADQFCIHPLFEHIFPSPLNRELFRVIYPYGSRHDQERVVR